MSRSHQLFLNPVSSLYFGPPGAFNAGEDHVGESWFPPPISSFQGMIRTKLLQEVGVFNPRERVADLVGTPDKLPEGWQLTGPFPARYLPNNRFEVWLPAPAFLLPPMDKHATTPLFSRQCSPEEEEVMLMDDGMRLNDSTNNSEPNRFLSLAGKPGTAEDKPMQGWLSARNLLWALNPENSKLQWKPHGCTLHLPPFVFKETKSGLAREKESNNSIMTITGRPKESMLYFLKRLRFAPLSGLTGSLKLPDASPLPDDAAMNHGTLPGGSKGGVVAFEKLTAKDDSWEKIINGDHLVSMEQDDPKKPELDMVWITLISPGQWKSFDNLSSMLKSPEPVSLTIISLVGHAPIYLGGYNLVKKLPRQAMPWYPAGTSILARLSGGSAEERINYLKELNYSCLLAPEERRPFGYGHILVTAPFNSGGSHA
ncbi:MAG: type III-B CRISPR module-associated Cmr3 family protein [Desulfobacterium sp.]